MATHPLHRKDGVLTAVKALPASAGSVYTAAFDLGAGPHDLVDSVDIEVIAPALNTTQLPDTKTVTYFVQTSADDSTYVNLFEAVIVQTGAGAAGDVTSTVVLPLRGRINAALGNLRRYVRVGVTTGTGAGDCSAAEVTASLLL